MLQQKTWVINAEFKTAKKSKSNRPKSSLPTTFKPQYKQLNSAVSMFSCKDLIRDYWA
jgi:hypothetical protein